MFIKSKIISVVVVVVDVFFFALNYIDGHSYERLAMQKWITDGNVTSPLTNEILASQILTPNYNLRSLIQKFRSTIPPIPLKD